MQARGYHPQCHCGGTKAFPVAATEVSSHVGACFPLAFWGLIPGKVGVPFLEETQVSGRALSHEPM